MSTEREKLIKREYGSLSKFRQQKRAELRGLENQLKILLIDADALPTRSYHRADIIRSQVSALREELSVKEWGK